MRIVFMGTPAFAVPTLVALHEAGHDLAAVYTQPPRPARRGQQLVTSPVQQAAEALSLAVRHPETLRDLEPQADFLALEAEVAVVAAYGLILPQPILTGPPRGCLNVHGSLLPRWRGAAPIQRAILADDAVTGVTIMQMEAGLDTGPMLASARVPIEDKTSGELHAELAEIGARLMCDTLERLDQIRPEPQPEFGATYAAKIDKAESRIDWSKPAELLEREVRAFAPFPGSWFELEGERISCSRPGRSGSTALPGPCSTRT
jgi:methionyl-tRNA formyltransferase